MKRSEVLEKIIEIMAYNTGHYSDAEEQAPKVLDFLEEIGMKPPKNGSDYESYGSGDDYFCTSTPRYDWDKE